MNVASLASWETFSVVLQHLETSCVHSASGDGTLIPLKPRGHANTRRLPTCTAVWLGDDPTEFSCCGCVVPKDAGIILLPESCPIRMNAEDSQVQDVHERGFFLLSFFLF